MPERAEQQHFPVLERVLDSLAGWVNYYRDLHRHTGLARCDRDEVLRIAHDLGVSPGELRQLAEKGPHAADLVQRMLPALGIDPNALAVHDPALMQDLQRLCSTCRNKARCEQELAHGTAAEHFQEFCTNAFTLEALTAEKNGGHKLS